MPVFNGFVRDQNQQLSPGGLVQVGAVLALEVHVPPVIAQVLTEQEQPTPTPHSGMAMIDTGATLTCVHEPTLTQLGLSPVGIVNSGTAGGQMRQNLYPVRLIFPGLPGAPTIDALNVIGVDLSGQVVPTSPPQPMTALIGRNLLQGWTLVWNGPGGFWTVAY